MRLLVGLLLSAAVVIALAYVFQRKLIYLPDGDVVSIGRGLPGAEETQIRTEDGLELGAWFIPGAREGRAPAVLVANGNAGNRSHRAPFAAALASRGISVLLFDYRGYGGNPGSPSEEGLRRDARAARDYLVQRTDVDPNQIVYFGESLGAAVVVDLAVMHRPAGLVLRSPFTSLADVGKVHYPWLPVNALLRDRYESASAISRVGAPLLVIAGDRDRIVPASQSRALFDAAPEPKHLLIIEGADHNDPALFIGERLVDETVRFIEETTASPL